MTSSTGDPAGPRRPESSPADGPVRWLVFAGAGLAVLIYLLGFTSGVSALISPLPSALLLGGGLLMAVSALPGARWLLAPAVVATTVGVLQVIQKTATTSSSLSSTAIATVVLCVLLLLATVAALLIDQNLWPAGARRLGGFQFGRSRNEGGFRLPRRGQPQSAPGHVPPGAAAGAVGGFAAGGLAQPHPGMPPATGGQPFPGHAAPGMQYPSVPYGPGAQPAGGTYSPHPSGSPPSPAPGPYGAGPASVAQYGGGQSGAPYSAGQYPASPYGAAPYPPGQHSGAQAPYPAQGYAPSPGGYGGYPPAPGYPPGALPPPGAPYRPDPAPAGAPAMPDPLRFPAGSPAEAGPNTPPASSGQPLPATRQFEDPTAVLDQERPPNAGVDKAGTGSGEFGGEDISRAKARDGDTAGDNQQGTGSADEAFAGPGSRTDQPTTEPRSRQPHPDPGPEAEHGRGSG